MKANRGFTLVEILIVVVILGILAAIVIPQFTEASTESKASRLASDLQMLRSQIELYKVQHNDNLPTAALFLNAMTMASASTASAEADYAVRAADNKTTHPYGPYMQTIPTNPFAPAGVGDVVLATGADAATCGWTYNQDTGEIRASDADHTGL